MKKVLRALLMFMTGLLIGSLIGLIGLIIVSLLFPNREKQPVISYPEEWQAITTDTMRVVRIQDTLFIEFIH